MANNGNIILSREEWAAFNRRINTPDPERTRRAEAFLHEYDGIVSVNREGDHTEIDLPWLEDNELLELLKAKERKPKKIASQMQSEDYWVIPQVDVQMTEAYTNLNFREITSEGEYMYVQTKSYSGSLCRQTEREYSSSIDSKSLLLCA